ARDAKLRALIKHANVEDVAGKVEMPVEGYRRIVDERADGTSLRYDRDATDGYQRLLFCRRGRGRDGRMANRIALRSCRRCSSPLRALDALNAGTQRRFPLLQALKPLQYLIELVCFGSRRERNQPRQPEGRSRQISHKIPPNPWHVGMPVPVWRYLF